VNGGNTQAWESRALSPPSNPNISAGQQNKLFYSQSYGKQEQGLTVFYN
jgi:hypothetical protein